VKKALAVKLSYQGYGFDILPRLKPEDSWTSRFKFLLHYTVAYHSQNHVLSYTESTDFCSISEARFR
jgi:hypothetical protein